MNISVGDKFIIEVGEVFRGAESGQPKYRIKGFDNLVFDEKGLGKLKAIDDRFDSNEEAYMKGYQVATLKGVKIITEMAEKYAVGLGEEDD